MDFNSLEEIKKNGFIGFKTIGELCIDSDILPKKKGVYLVLHLVKKPVFLINGTGGFFKGKNPNVQIDELNNNWVKNSKVVYIGKAGGNLSKATLHSRLKQYLDFGRGKSVGHWGGRYIWQISNSNELVICWKELDKEEPNIIESGLIKIFSDKYGKRPFANLKD